MKNGIAYSDIQKMDEKEVLEFFMIIAEESIYEKEQIDIMKAKI
jgi:hypothetical protein